MTITLPAMLNIPPKLQPMITKFNGYKYFLGKGGRGSAKTQSAARFLLYLAGQYKIRIVCGREVQNSIEESVYAVLKDLIEDFSLPYTVTLKYIQHTVTGSRFMFKGFRDQGKTNIKGLEGVDILWIDEAQSITALTLETLIPTIRKNNCRVMFTMNPFMRDDPVPSFLDNRPDCLTIEINYHENPFCPNTIKIEAQALKAKSEKEYKHVYLGVPLTSASDFLFDYEDLHNSFKTHLIGETHYPSRVLSFDFAAQGDDQCVATVLDRMTNQHWQCTEQIPWDEPNTMISTGKIVDYIGKYKPTVSILDVGGMGHVVHNRLEEIGVNIQRFDGASTINIDTKLYLNTRAAAYYKAKEWFEEGFIKMLPANMDCIKELEKIKMQYRSNGRRVIQPKVEMKLAPPRGVGFSPDRADSLIMGIWAAHTHLGNPTTEMSPASQNKPTRTSRKRRDTQRRR
ncbi:MAG: PBSX family phage terminase large subunit [Methylococcaceae bacterium]